MKANQKLKIVTSWLAVFVWMIVIFYLSSQTAQDSDKFSKAITGIIIKFIGFFRPLSIETSNTQNWFDLMNSTVREYAHGTVYYILVLLVCNAFFRCGIRGWRLYLFSIIFCVVYAVSDELHQLFVPGRGAEVEDFITDSIGALIGLPSYGVIRSVNIFKNLV